MKLREKSRLNNKSAGLLTVLELKSFRYRFLYWVCFAIVALVSIFVVAPVIWVVVSAFKTPQEMYSIPPTLLPESFDFSIIPQVWSKVKFGNAFKNSLILIVGCLIFDIGLNGMLGYVISRLKPTGSKLIDKLVFWSMLLPGISMVPLYITFVDVPLLHINLTGSYLPMWLMAGCNAFNVLLFKNFFDGIPMSYLEAARIDGGGEIYIFLKIILPLAKPILAVVTIFSITGTWANFMWPYLILGSTDLEPVAVKLYQLSMEGNLLDNEFLMVTLLTILPPLVIYCFLSKHIQGGVSMEGIKG